MGSGTQLTGGSTDALLGVEAHDTHRVGVIAFLPQVFRVLLPIDNH
jgi:hypothetical protein